MKILVVLLLLLTCNALIINADKQYRCYHVNATFGEPVGLRDVTGPFVLVDPIYACGTISSNLTNSIALLMKNVTETCHPALQVHNVQEKGAVGAVVMNTYDPFYESFEIVDDDKKDDYNITIPVVGILYQDGATIANMIKQFPVVNATINREYEYVSLSFWEYLGVFFMMIVIMWGGWLVLFAFSRISDWIKKYRRSNYVKKIKTTRYHMKKEDVEEKPTCSVCLCEFEERDLIKKLRCGHVFHAECIDPWLINAKAVCPICRQGIYEVDDWNLLEENESREIDIMLTRIENTTMMTFNNIFSMLCCCGFFLFPLLVVLVSK